MNAISVVNLSKEFTLAARRPSYGTFKDLFDKGPFRKESSSASAAAKFHALSDVSFEVERGEVLGIIGRNGAGKSTLLKILSRILRPTSGTAKIRGSVGSLLEVGAGFHPELTGRENIFLNGAILGLSHAQIAAKFDEIVAFSGVEQYLDEPVKHYSSGMHMRLAFSVAAHIEPEILLIDEVLAVGDADFQKKSIERIEQVGRDGQTVVVVSHNIQTVLRLCRRVVCLDQGRIAAIGAAEDVAAQYLEIGGANRGVRTYAEGPYAPGDGVVRLRGVRIRTRAGDTLGTVQLRQEFGIEMQFEVLEAGAILFPSLTLQNPGVHQQTAPAIWTTDAASDWHGRPRKAGRYTEIAWVPAHLLSSGVMRVTAAVHSFRPHCVHFVEPDAVVFHAVEADEGARGQYMGPIESATRPLLPWTVEYDG
jgi:lipopolysaccharide transport system ATP-binding protein